MLAAQRPSRLPARVIVYTGRGRGSPSRTTRLGEVTLGMVVEALVLGVERSGSTHALIEPEPGAVEKPHKELEEIRGKVEHVEEGLAELGAAVKSLQSQVEGYSAVLSLYEHRVSKLEALHKAASMIGSWKAQTCLHSHNGVCTLWRLSREAAEQLQGLVVEDGAGVYRVRVAEAPWFCGLCPLYQRA